jgi:hypothetical protein
MTEERTLPERKSRNRNWRRRDDGADAVQGACWAGKTTEWRASRTFLNKLRALRGPGESYSNVILRVAAGERHEKRGLKVRLRRPVVGGLVKLGTSLEAAAWGARAAD